MDRKTYKSKPQHLVKNARTGEIERIVHSADTDIGTSKSPSSLTVYGSLSGSIQQTAAGLPYLVAGANVTISSGSNGQITIAASGSGGSFQPLDSDLTAIAALTTTTYGRSLLTLADEASLTTALAAARVTALDNNHLHVWDCQDTSGNLVDTGSSASKVNLTATTGVDALVYEAIGPVGKAVEFFIRPTGVAVTNGATAQVLTSAFSDLPLTNMTLECWYMCRADAGVTRWLMGWNQSGTHTCQVTFEIAGSMNWTINTSGTSAFNKSTVVGAYATPHIWHHCALVKSSALGTGRLYIDGELIGESTCTGNITYTAGTTPRFGLGFTANLGNSNQFKGFIQRFRLSDIARDQTYMRAVYKKGMGF